MRALLSHEPGGPETLRVEEAPDPVPGPGELLVHVRACAINYPDVLIIEEKYQLTPPRPFAPGSEIAGEVEAVGDQVSGWRPGDRLIAATGFGGLVDKIVIPADRAIPLPAERSFAEGSALLLTYATAIHALVDRGRLERGRTLLVLGAAGGVGLAAVELGKAMGARVIAAASSAEKVDLARAHGADEGLVYPAGPLDKAGAKAFTDALKAVCGMDGANVIYDPVGGDYSEAALRAIAWEGRFLVVGFPAGIPKLPLNLTLLKSCQVVGVFWGAFAERDPTANAENTRELFALYERGAIRPTISDRVPLERAEEAIAALAGRRAMGKIVVTMGAAPA
jgi:NADPH:quinone reductase-like Zn-dependent oxidoreductase